MKAFYGFVLMTAIVVTVFVGFGVLFGGCVRVFRWVAGL